MVRVVLSPSIPHARLGHADLSITLRVYAHVIGDRSPRRPASSPAQ